MSGWSGGYVADLEYTAGYYRQQAPAHMALAALLGGVEPGWPPANDAAHYLEIGCGRGLTATLIAASNPTWRVTAIDYNPAPIAEARALARRAGVDNVSFLEADLTTFAETDTAAAIPPVDIASLHGVWSWVSPAVRAGIVRLLRDKLVAGGLAQISYNALPAWHGSLGLQRLIYEAGRRAGGRSDRQVTAGLEMARELLEAKAHYLISDGLSRELVGQSKTMPVQYLAHEYMNQHWAPCFHADVAADVGAAKLEFVASVSLLETFPDLALPPEVRTIYDRAEDPLFRELIKDMSLPRQLRNDLFVRGPRRLTNVERDARLRNLTLALTVSEAEVNYKLEVPAGSGELGPAFRPIIAALAKRPTEVGELLSLVPGHSNPAEVAGVLVGTNQALVVARPGASPGDAARRLNAVLTREVRAPVGREGGGGLASVKLGAALPAGWLEQFVSGRLSAGETVNQVDGWVAALTEQVVSEKLGELRAMFERIVRDRSEVFTTLL